MIKVSSTTILQDLLEICDDCFENFKESGLINSPDQKEMVKFESQVLSFWLFQKEAIFPNTIQKLILDEIHNKYYNSLKKAGYNTKLIQSVCDAINLRYKAYNNTDLSEVEISLDFIKFLSNDTKDYVGPEHLVIPLYIINKVSSKIDEFRNVIR